MLFHISDVLSVITGRLLSRDGLDGIYRILNYMTGDSIYTHQIPRALRACAPALKAQYPHLADAAARWQGASTQEAIAAWVAQFGPEHLDVQPLDAWVQRNPATELAELAGADRVIVVNLDDPDNERN